jgi:TetR/AcrR family transcriptional regulator, transcriptional repressor for nem operon
MDINDGPRSRGEIVAAPAALVGQGGTEDLSLDDVSRAAVVARAQVDKHFPDIGADLLAVCAARLPASPAGESPHALDSIGALRAWAELYVDRLQCNNFRDPGVLGILAGPPAQGGPVAQADATAELRGWIASLACALRGMRERGVLRPEVEPDALASTVVAMLLGGSLLAQARRDAAPLRAAIAVMMARVESFSAGGGCSPRPRP